MHILRDLSQPLKPHHGLVTGLGILRMRDMSEPPAYRGNRTSFLQAGYAVGSFWSHYWLQLGKHGAA